MRDDLVLLRIVDAAGNPVPGATLSVVRGSVPYPEIALRADHAGVVRLRVPDGTFVFRAHDAAGQTGEVEVDGMGAGLREFALRIGGKIQ